MYSQENYIWGLVVYVTGVLLILPFGWRLSRWIMPWRPLRNGLRLLVLAFLLTPMQPHEGLAFLAPAWVVAAFEMLEPTSGTALAQAVALLAVSCTGVIVLYILWAIARHMMGSGRVRKPQRQQPPARAKKSDPGPRPAARAPV